jgi:DNA-binding NarL/FixJ family response regulator
MVQRKPVKIMIADDHPFVIKSFSMIFAQISHVDIVGTARDGDDLLSSVDSANPDAIFMDIRMPRLNGIQTLKKLSERGSRAKVICITGFDDEHDLIEMLKAGAKGFILKTSDTQEAVRALDKVLAGEEYYCKDAINIMIKRFIRNTPYMESSLKFEGFSKKELEVVKLICKQKTSKEISDELFLGEKTVNYYRQRIIEKMKVRSSIGIVVYAIKNNMVNISELY